MLDVNVKLSDEFWSHNLILLLKKNVNFWLVGIADYCTVLGDKFMNWMLLILFVRCPFRVKFSYLRLWINFRFILHAKHQTFQYSLRNRFVLLILQLLYVLTDDNALWIPISFSVVPSYGCSEWLNWTSS